MKAVVYLCTSNKLMNTISKENFRFYELDIMRFTAALAVLLYHYTFGATRLYGTPAFGADALFRYGYLGVDAFFMISGYVVLMSSMHKTPKYFFISRVVRLYPAFWVSCLLTFAILYFGKISQPGAPQATFKLLAYNLTMLQGFFGKQDLNGVFWTLTYEIGFYFIIIIISALKLWKNLLLIIILWLAYTLIAGANTSGTALSFFLIPKFSCCFIAGMLFYLLRIKYADTWKICVLLVLCYILNIKNDVLIMDKMNEYYHDAHAYSSYAMTAIVTGLYLFFLLSAAGKLDFPRLRSAARVGTLTYPLYLTHIFGIGVFMLWGGQINKYILFIAVTLFMIAFAAVIHKFVEEKFRARFKTLITAILDRAA